MKRYLGTSLIVLGILIIGSSLFIKFQADYKKNILLNEYKERMISLQNDEYENSNVNNNDENVINENEFIESNSDEKEVLDIKNENVIGIIEIPKIELTAPIGQGTDKETLKYAVGHFEETAMPGQKGNCCIIGHRSYTYGEFFNRLDEIKEKDKIIVSFNNNTYNYIVKKIFVVEPEEISVLEDNKDIESEITLITCTPLRVGTHRLIIKGELEK